MGRCMCRACTRRRCRGLTSKAKAENFKKAWDRRVAARRRVRQIEQEMAFLDDFIEGRIEVEDLPLDTLEYMATEVLADRPPVEVATFVHRALCLQSGYFAESPTGS